MNPKQANIPTHTQNAFLSAQNIGTGELTGVVKGCKKQQGGMAEEGAR